MALMYFELFEIPVQLQVSTQGLAKKYFELSRKFHPDYFINDSEETQAEVLEKSAMLNRALKTFQSKDATLKYVLQEKNMLQEEEKYELSSDFLMEVMEINEAIMDAEVYTSKSDLLEKIETLESEIYAPVKNSIENYQEGVTSEAELLQVKDYYFKKKYIDRIKRELKD
jgi:molecular chaperone HscB